MKRIILLLLAIVALSGVAYAVYLLAPRVPEFKAVTPADTGPGTEMKVEAVNADTPAYHIEVRYPQFGITSADEKIKEVVDKAVAAFKDYPANPAGSSVRQNELTGSFDSVYVGTDIVSVALSLSEDTGGAHPNTVIVGVNVDRATGKEISLDDALTMIGKTLPQVAGESLKELKATLGDDIIAPEGASATAENYSTFLVSYDRVTFIFNNYQVAPYAAGQQQVWFKRVK
ncbi:MAG: DUF3298 domain-containing protein [bacterium]|nr:DUF3298 domain-containing protein [bacterium]